MKTKHKSLEELKEDNNYDHESPCGCCIDLNEIPKEGGKCFFSQKKCYRHEYLKHIYGDDWKYHLT